MLFRALSDWIDRRRQIRLRWQHDARTLLHSYDRHAYYEAQRRAAHARTQHDRPAFWHWAKVAAEVARLSPEVEMDLGIVQAVANGETGDDEHHR